MIIHVNVCAYFTLNCTHKFTSYIHWYSQVWLRMASLGGWKQCFVFSWGSGTMYCVSIKFRDFRREIWWWNGGFPFPRVVDYRRRIFQRQQVLYAYEKKNVRKLVHDTCICNVYHCLIHKRRKGEGVGTLEIDSWNIISWNG